MRNKGFTLIELLAVIVILAIISLIAIPIIINIIEDSKESSRLRSAELYISTLNTALVRQAINGPVLNGIYDVMNNGNLCLGEIQNNTCNGTEVKVEMEGTLPTAGSITIENGKIIDIQGLTIEGYVYGYDENNNIQKEDIKEYTDESYFITTTKRVVSYEVTASCPAVAQATAQSMGVTWDETKATSFCNGNVVEGISLEELIQNPNFLDILLENDAVTSVVEEDINGIAIVGYTGEDTDIVIPKIIDDKRVTEIRFAAFMNKNLTSVIIPNGIESIRDSAFVYCSNLTSVKISNSVRNIGRNAFNGCTSLTSVTIGSSVRNIGEYAFWGCSSLSSITIPNSVTSIGDGAFENCSSLTSIIIPNSVESIGNSAFEGCSSLTSITIPDSVTSIGNHAFYSCSSLTSVTIGSGVTSIGAGAFRNCSSLASIKVDTNNPIYEDRNSNAIIKKSNNELVVGCKNTIIPNSVTSIGNYAFSGSGLTSITIPNSVESIGMSAFSGCGSLTSVTIGNSVTSIGNYALSGCINLISVTFSNPTGWWYANSADATSGTSLDLSNEEQNATYFKSTYADKYWIIHMPV